MTSILALYTAKEPPGSPSTAPSLGSRSSPRPCTIRSAARSSPTGSGAVTARSCGSPSATWPVTPPRDLGERHRARGRPRPHRDRRGRHQAVRVRVRGRPDPARQGRAALAPLRPLLLDDQPRLDGRDARHPAAPRPGEPARRLRRAGPRHGRRAVVFWIGRGRYVHMPPVRSAPPASPSDAAEPPARAAILRILA